MTTLTLATWNVNSLKVRLEHVLSWLAGRDDIDALVLQETKLTDDKFPQGELALAGWESVFYGQPTYNGVALLTRPDRVTVSDVTLGMPGYADDQRRYLSATVTPVGTTDSVRFAGVYCPNGMEAGSRKYLYKLDWFHALRRAMRVEREKNERVVLAGDFNIAPADADLWNPQTWPDKILTTGPERTALERLLSDGFVDAFRAFPQKEKQFSWWDYRMAAYEQNHGLRIDLMLASDALRPALKACQIDETPRAWAKPSDHAPVVTTLSF